MIEIPSYFNVFDFDKMHSGASICLVFGHIMQSDYYISVIKSVSEKKVMCFLTRSRRLHTLYDICNCERCTNCSSTHLMFLISFSTIMLQ